MFIEVQSDPSARRWKCARNFFTISFGLGLLTGFGCWGAAGAELNLFLAPLVFGCLIAPPLAATASNLAEMLSMSGGLTLGTASLWVLATYGRAANAGQLFRCSILLFLLISSLGALVFLLRVFLPSLWPATITSFASLSWMTWPFWASRYVGTSVHWLVSLHPLFAINSVVTSFGIFTEQQFAYGLTTLGQDVAYALPGSIWPCAVFELSLTALFLALAKFVVVVVSLKSYSH